MPQRKEYARHRPSDPYYIPGMRASGIVERQARMDSTALLTAKLVELNTGERLLIERSMIALMDDPQRMGGVVIAFLNLIAQYATASGRRPQGLQEVVDFLLTQLGIEG